MTFDRHDDRCERPAGVTARVALPGHPILTGVDDDWPPLLGYNRAMARGGAAVVAMVGDDPLIVAGAHGQGRGVAFASDCGPHWAPPAFTGWAGYAPLWANMAGWAAGRIG